MIPDEVRDFIHQRLDSVAELEALLLLWRNPSQAWDIASLARRLYISETYVKRILWRLQEQRLVTESSGLYRYWRSSEELGGIVDQLARLYSTHLVPITNLMHSKPSNRVQKFAEAFVLKKDK